jgi:hypothetical protein
MTGRNSQPTRKLTFATFRFWAAFCPSPNTGGYAPHWAGRTSKPEEVWSSGRSSASFQRWLAGRVYGHNAKRQPLEGDFLKSVIARVADGAIGHVAPSRTLPDTGQSRPTAPGPNGDLGVHRRTGGLSA